MKSKEYTILFESWRRFIEDNSSRMNESVAGKQKRNMIENIDSAYNSAEKFFNNFVKTKEGAILAIKLIDNCVRSYDVYLASDPDSPEVHKLSAAATGDKLAEIPSESIAEVIEKFSELKKRIVEQYGIEELYGIEERELYDEQFK